MLINPFKIRLFQDASLSSASGSVSRVVIGLIFLLSAFAVATPAFGQVDNAPDARYTFAAIDMPLSTALDLFIEQAGVNVAVDIDLIEGNKTFCRAVDLKVSEVFRCLLQGSGLDFIRLSSGTFVIVEHVKAPPQWGDLTGRVVDVESGEPLADAHVLMADAGTGDVTNNSGRFAFAGLKPGPYRIVITYLGYQDFADTVNVQPSTNTRVEFGMYSEPLLSSPIVVNGMMRRLPSEDLQDESGDIEELSENPGSRDVIRSMNTIVGIRIGDSMADVHVQGGDAGEHQYRLDGAPVFIPIPNGGIVGPFSAFALDKFTIHKAGFGATHGSQLSGVIEAEHRLTPVLGSAFDVQVDPLSVNARVMGRVGNREVLGANWMVAARKGLWSIYQPRGLSNHFSDWSRPDLFLLQALALHNRPETGVYEENGSLELLDASLRSGLRDGFQDHFDFYDFHAASRIHFGPLKSLHASLYLGGNTLGDDEVVLGRRPQPQGNSWAFKHDDDDDEGDYLSFENDYDWNNKIASLKYEQVLGHRTFAEWSAWYSSFELTQHSGQKEYEYEEDRSDSLPPFVGYPVFSPDSLAALGFASNDNNRIAEYGVRSELNHAFGDRHFVTAGIEGIRTGSEFVLDLQLPRISGYNRPAQVQMSPELWRFAGYLEDKYSFDERTTLNAGLRLTYLSSQRQIFAEPRISFRHDVAGGTWAFRGAVGLYRQFVNQFEVASLNVNALLPGVRFWMPLDEYHAPPKALHSSVATLFMPDPTWQLRLEGYFKRQPHLLVIDYASPVLRGAERSVLTDQRDLLTDADGFAYGGAFSVRKKEDLWTASLQYEYSAASQRIANRFDGNYVAVPWNIPQRVSAAIDLQATDHLTFLGRLQYNIGQSWAFRDAYYNYLEPDEALRLFGPYDLSDPEAHRLPVVTQLDLGVSYAQRIKDVNVQLRLDLANVLSFTNVEEWSLFYDRRVERYALIERPITPFLPSVVMRVSW